jgi:hypothetical protein
VPFRIVNARFHGDCEGSRGLLQKQWELLPNQALYQAEPQPVFTYKKRLKKMRRLVVGVIPVREFNHTAPCSVKRARIALKPGVDGFIRRFIRRWRDPERGRYGSLNCPRASCVSITLPDSS